MVDLIELNLFWGRSTIWIFEHEMLTGWNWGMITWYIKTGLGANWTTTTRRWLHIATAFLFFFLKPVWTMKKNNHKLTNLKEGQENWIPVCNISYPSKKTETRSIEYGWNPRQTQKTTKILETNFCFEANFFFHFEHKLEKEIEQASGMTERGQTLGFDLTLNNPLANQQDVDKKDAINHKLFPVRATGEKSAWIWVGFCVCHYHYVLILNWQKYIVHSFCLESNKHLQMILTTFRN